MLLLEHNKAHGPDRVQAWIFQNQWEIVKPNFIKGALKLFQGISSVRNINHTNICLIPNMPVPEGIHCFRPIGLCNLSCKILSKVMLQCIQPFPPNLIGEEQSSFVPSRHIVDNVVIIQEAIRSITKKSSPLNKLASKVDLKRTYDHLCWNFYLKTLELATFPMDVIRIISTLVMHALGNGVPSKEFKLTRGIH